MICLKSLFDELQLFLSSTEDPCYITGYILSRDDLWCAGLACNVRPRCILTAHSHCRVLLAEKDKNISKEAQGFLQTAEVGVKCLDLVPHPWKERLAPLIQQPHLQLESLVMVQQFDAALDLLAAFPALHDDKMLLHYGR